MHVDNIRLIWSRIDTFFMPEGPGYEPGVELVPAAGGPGRQLKPLGSAVAHIHFSSKL